MSIRLVRVDNCNQTTGDVADVKVRIAAKAVVLV
jgi:hypothetical protein